MRKCFVFRYLSFVVLFLAAWVHPTLHAQTAFPNRPIRVINPLAAGGALDILLRRVGQAYNERTGQNFLVESKPGANTIIAAEACAKAPPDGYTICLLSSSTITLNPALYKKLPYEVPKSFEPITQLAYGTQVMIVRSTLPVSNIDQLVAYSKANPQKINFASLGTGGDRHLAMEWLKQKTGSDWTHVAYKGYAPAMNAFTTGEVDLMFVLVGNPGLLNNINSGQIRPLLVAGNARSPLLSSVPTFSEAGMPLSVHTWFGIFAPAGTPKNIVAKLNSDIAAIVKSEEFKTKYLVPTGFESVGSSPEEFARFINEDVQKGAELVKLVGVTLD